MTVTIDFDPTTEARLDALARAKGIDAPTLIKEMVTENLPSDVPVPDEESQRLIDLLRQWRKEDETDDEEELMRRDEETEALLQNLQANRVSFPPGPA